MAVYESEASINSYVLDEDVFPFCTRSSVFTIIVYRNYEQLQVETGTARRTLHSSIEPLGRTSCRIDKLSPWRNPKQKPIHSTPRNGSIQFRQQNNGISTKVQRRTGSRAVGPTSLAILTLKLLVASDIRLDPVGFGIYSRGFSTVDGRHPELSKTQLLSNKTRRTPFFLRDFLPVLSHPIQTTKG